MGRRPELKSDEFFETTPNSSRDNLTFVFETAEKVVQLFAARPDLERLLLDCILAPNMCSVNVTRRYLHTSIAS